MTEHNISILTYDSRDLVENDGSKGLGDILFGAGDNSSKAIRHFQVDVDKLENQMTELLQKVGKILSNAKKRAGDIAEMELEEVELSVEINGQGEVSLLGIGGQAGASGAITLKFKRRPA